MIFTKEKIELACVSALQWWVFYEHDFHKLFSRHSITDLHKKSEIQNAFYDFTILYSVKRNIKGKGMGPTNQLLNDLNVFKFEKRVKQNDITVIDEFDQNYDPSIVSLLSKYATLINPEYYTMRDTKAVNGLRQFGLKHKKNSYQEFYGIFVKYRNEVENEIKDQTSFYFDILLKRFPNKAISEAAFKNRVLDKILWVVSN